MLCIYRRPRVRLLWVCLASVWRPYCICGHPQLCLLCGQHAFAGEWTQRETIIFKDFRKISLPGFRLTRATKKQCYMITNRKLIKQKPLETMLIILLMCCALKSDHSETHILDQQSLSSLWVIAHKTRHEWRNGITVKAHEVSYYTILS